jgi:hypothetical protein
MFSILISPIIFYYKNKQYNGTRRKNDNGRREHKDLWLSDSGDTYLRKPACPAYRQAGGRQVSAICGKYKKLLQISQINTDLK